jgi:hypothetical protein
MLDKVNSFQNARKEEASITASGIDFSKPLDE